MLPPLFLGIMFIIFLCKETNFTSNTLFFRPSQPVTDFNQTFPRRTGARFTGTRYMDSDLRPINRNRDRWFEAQDTLFNMETESV